MVLDPQRGLGSSRKPETVPTECHDSPMSLLPLGAGGWGLGTARGHSARTELPLGGLCPAPPRRPFNHHLLRPEPAGPALPQLLGHVPPPRGPASARPPLRLQPEAKVTA